MKLVARKPVYSMTFLCTVTWALPTRHNTKSDSNGGGMCTSENATDTRRSRTWLMFVGLLGWCIHSSEDMTRLCRAKISHPEYSFTWLFLLPPRYKQFSWSQVVQRESWRLSVLIFIDFCLLFFDIPMSARIFSEITAPASMSPTDVDDDRSIKAFGSENNLLKK